MSTMPDPGRGPARTYRAGEWFGILGARAIVLLPPTEKHRVAALWELVDAGAGFDVTLDALISGGLRELPGFVLVSTTDDQTQVVLRGAARAELDAGGERVVVEGSRATTWVERTVSGVTALGLVVGEEDSDTSADVADRSEPVGAGTTFLVDGGLVRLSRLDEAPAHAGADESSVEPAYEREFPLGASALAIETEPDADPSAEPDADPSGDPFGDPFGDPEAPEDAPRSAESAAEPPPEHQPVAEVAELAPTEPDLQGDADPVAEPEVAPERSPQPPSWTPGSPAAPLPPVSPPSPFAAPPAGPVPAPSPFGPDGADAVPAPSPVDPVDHDGLTTTGSWQPAPPVPPGIPGQPPAPDVTRAVARLEISGGEVVEVDRAVVLGRAPEPRLFSGTEQPRLVTVRSPNLEVSSTHLEVRPGTGVDHGFAVATDLGSTNGTVLVQAGLAPQDLPAGEPVQLLPGAVLDLGDGVLVRVSQPAR